MAKLEGIIYKSLDNFVVLRGFAPIGVLSNVSHKSAAYQRPADDDHKKDIIKFIYDGKYTYFPDVILACRAKNYSDFLLSIGVDNSVDPHDSIHVDGLKIMSEYLPVGGHRARHGNLTVRSKQLARVDGNHRLEPFDEDENSGLWSGLTSNAGGAIQKKDVINKIIPFTVIFTDELQAERSEAGIFHNINFRHLPLRREASLKIISELETFDDLESLGGEYPLTVELIKKAESNEFKGIPFLTPLNDDTKDVYRTSCLRIAKLLLDKKTAFEKELENIKYNEVGDRLKEIERKMADLKEKRIKLQIDIVGTEAETKQNKNDIRTIDGEIDKISNELISIRNINKRRQLLQGYIKQITADEIAKSIQFLRHIYDEQPKHKGNIELLSSLIHYRIYSKNMFNSFLKWIERNRIYEIDSHTEEIPQCNHGSIIKLFEEIYKVKRRQIFISIQFGDDQSELIYEKIIQAIKSYDEENDDTIKVMPLRIDRSEEPLAFDITDKILKAINNSSLIIADLSSANMNVYHEIGYAMGIAKERGETPPIILLYKENTSHNPDDIDHDKFIGFNLRGVSQLRFSDYDHLVRQLRERIKRHFEE